MKYWVIIFVISGCIFPKKTTSTTVILDGSKSYISGGDGSGYFKSWNWRQIQGTFVPIDSPKNLITKTVVTSSGNYSWELTGIDNLNQVGKDTFSVKIN